VELCAGEYWEDLLFENRRIEVVGGGERPEDVTLTPATENGLLASVTGGDSELTLRWLRMVSDEPGGDNALAVYGGRAVSLDTVTTCGGMGAFTMLIYVSPEGADQDLRVSVSRSNLCFEGASRWLAYLRMERATFEVAQNVIHSAEWHSGLNGVTLGHVANGHVLFHNNIVYGDGGAAFSSTGAPAGEKSVEVWNNTFVALGALTVSSDADADDGGAWPDPMDFRDNIVVDIPQPTEDTAFWDSIWISGGSTSREEAEITIPDDFGGNLIWHAFYETSLPLIRARVAACSTCSPSTYDFTEDFLPLAIQEDPQFSPSAEQGSYALAATSPAIDAGTGDPDPDGSPNDIGAFGGPDGAWYLEVPWPLP
jgi:hypothetical protein